MSKFKFTDAVSMRMVQIFQEALITGCDGADLLRQVEVEVSSEDPSMLTLTEAYVKLVDRSYEELVKRAQELEKNHAQKGKVILTDGND